MWGPKSDPSQNMWQWQALLLQYREQEETGAFSAAPVEGSGAQKSENSALSAESVSLGFSACKLYACILYYSSWCAGLAVCHKQKSKKARHISSHTSRNQNEGKVRRKRPQSARARVRPTPAGGPTRSQDSRIAKAAPAGMRQRPAGS